MEENSKVMPCDDVPDRYADLANRAKSGSRKAAIRLFCLGCCGWSAKEVRLCTAAECALYRYREKG